MALEVLIPKLGMTMKEGTLTDWIAEPGQQIHNGDPLFSLATDKVDVEIEAEGEGILAHAVEPGVTLEPGAIVGWLLSAGESPPTAELTPILAPAAPETERVFSSPNARRVATEMGLDVTALTGTGPGGRIISADVLEYRAPSPSVSHPAVPSVSPPLRKYALDRGIDPSSVTGTGPAGKVLRADIDAASTSAQPVPAPGRADTVIPFSGMRRVIADRMHASLTEMAQLTHGYEVGMDAVVGLRAQLKADLAATDLPVPSLNDFVVRAAALALRQHPMLNARVESDGIHVLADIHVGLAVAVPGGLVAPVIRDAADKSVVTLAGEVRRLAGAARDGTLALAELEGSTFTVTSLGTYGVDMFTPIVNPGNVAILGVGRMRDGVAWDGDVPRRTQVLTLSLSFDHRVVDGAPAAEYLQTVQDLLAHPTRLLL